MRASKGGTCEVDAGLRGEVLVDGDVGELAACRVLRARGQPASAFAACLDERTVVGTTHAVTITRSTSHASIRAANGAGVMWSSSGFVRRSSPARRALLSFAHFGGARAPRLCTCVHTGMLVFWEPHASARTAGGNGAARAFIIARAYAYARAADGADGMRGSLRSICSGSTPRRALLRVD